MGAELHRFHGSLRRGQAPRQAFWLSANVLAEPSAKPKPVINGLNGCRAASICMQVAPCESLGVPQSELLAAALLEPQAGYLCSRDDRRQVTEKSVRLLQVQLQTAMRLPPAHLVCLAAKLPRPRQD